MKSRVIQDDPDDGRPPAEPQPAVPEPAPRRPLKRLLARFFRRDSRTNSS